MPTRHTALNLAAIAIFVTEAPGSRPQHRRRALGQERAIRQ